MRKPRRRPRADYWCDEPFRPALEVSDTGLKDPPQFVRFKQDDEPKPRRRVKKWTTRK